MTAKTKAKLKFQFFTGTSDTKNLSTLERNLEDLVDTVGGSPALVVAANNASDLEKGRADYVCDGVADEVEINAALAAGDDIRLTAGTFELVDSLTKFNLTAKKVVGAGFNTTILNFTPASTKDLIIIGDSALGASAGEGRQHTLRDFAIVGQNGNARYGIHLVYAASWNVFGNIWIEAFTHGVLCTTDSSQNMFSFIHTRDCTTYGIQVYGAAQNFYFCETSMASLGGTSGFRIQGSGTTFHGCVCDSYTLGFDFADYAEGVNVHGAHVESCESGINIAGAVGNGPTGITIIGGFVYNSSHVSDAAIKVARSLSVNIIGIYVKTTTSDVSLSADANVVDLFLMGNQFSDGTPTSINASAIVTTVGEENQGAAATTADGGTIAHSCSTTPTVAVVSGSVAGEIVTVTSLDGTNITVAIKDNDDSAGTSQTVYWRAIV